MLFRSLMVMWYPPWLWSCGAPPLVVVMAVPSHPQLCPPTCTHGRVVPPWSSLWLCGARSSSWSCGPPLVVVVAMWCLLAIGALPCLSSSPWVPSRPWVSLFIPWCPARPLVLPSHCGGCVVAMWCPPARPCHRECPPWSSWLCGGPPAHRHGCVVSPGSSLWSWCPPPIVLESVGAYVHGVRPTPQPPPIGCSCGGHFVVVMVVMEMKG